ncbi:MAG TPA: preprotein translocase subunit SecA, partial [Thermoanaerobaculia bacterium]|nr:preprotein translocase subunit SecA [Thermoanaerobaculia bacterium]
MRALFWVRTPRMIIDKALSKVFGTKRERDIKAMKPRVGDINALEPGIKALSNAQIRARVGEIRARIQDGLKNLPGEIEARRALSREVLDKELVEVFALVREAAWRSIGQRHYDVQLMGGMVLHEGKIAEMRTGEGKTLVATLAISLNALSGRGAHLVTVNDYL